MTVFFTLHIYHVIYLTIKKFANSSICATMRQKKQTPLNVKSEMGLAECRSSEYMHYSDELESESRAQTA
jgi:hypothetical protein